MADHIYATVWHDERNGGYKAEEAYTDLEEAIQGLEFVNDIWNRHGCRYAFTYKIDAATNAVERVNLWDNKGS